MPALYIGTNPQPTAQGVIVGCANGSHMRATATNTLNLPQPPVKAPGCHKIKNISLPLISVSKLCWAGCKVNFYQSIVTIQDNQGTELTTSERDPTHNLYTITNANPTCSSPNHTTCCRGGLYTMSHQGPHPIPPCHDGVSPLGNIYQCH